MYRLVRKLKVLYDVLFFTNIVLNGSLNSCYLSCRDKKIWIQINPLRRENGKGDRERRGGSGAVTGERRGGKIDTNERMGRREKGGGRQKEGKQKQR